jgi:predicted DNA-binding transcriptional regulator AlpA
VSDDFPEPDTEQKVVSDGGDGCGDDDELVDAPEACRVLGGPRKPIHKTTLNRGVRSGRYPPPVEMGPQLRRWIRGELRRCVRQLADQRKLRGGQ